MAEPIPSTLPARTEDYALHLMAKLSVPQIHAVLDFEGGLDGSRLERALRLLLDAEPVLGCRFVPRFLRGHWERLSPEELDHAARSRIEPAAAEERERHTATFLTEDMPADAGPRLAALWLRGDDGDRLVLKVHHQAADAGGTKELAYRLAAIYRTLAEDPDHRPEPRLGTRSLRQVYRPLMPGALLGLLRRMGQDLIDAGFPPAHLQLSMQRAMDDPPRFATLHLDAERVARIREHAPDATVNDLLLAAVFRALARVGKWNCRDALRIWGTVDLRRYLPGRRADGLCNLSGFMYVNLVRDLGEDYAATVRRVGAVVDRIKALWPGLGYPVGQWLSLGPMPLGLVDLLSRLLSGPLLRSMPPVLTNMGAIDVQALSFGSPALRHAHLVVPTSHPPGLIMGLSGFRGSITLSAGYVASALPTETIEALFAAVDAELPR